MWCARLSQLGPAPLLEAETTDATLRGSSEGSLGALISLQSDQHA